MTPRQHARYLDYRARHGYFGSGKILLSAAEFEPLDKELQDLEAMPESERADEDEARIVLLQALLFRD
jgi:hypothetical protein